MREIAPWDGALDAPPALLEGKVFEYFYVQRKEADVWKALAKECFPKLYENASSDKSEKKRLQSLWAQAVLDEIKAMREHGKHTLRWITAVVEAQAADHLFLRREALKHGPDSVEAKAARIVWDQCSNRIKDQAFAAMHLWTNKGGAQSGGVARMYKHQHELLEELDKHYTSVSKAVEAESKLPLPLHVIQATMRTKLPQTSPRRTQTHPPYMCVCVFVCLCVCVCLCVRVLTRPSTIGYLLARGLICARVFW